MGITKKDFTEKREYQHLKEKGEIISNAEYTESILNKIKPNTTIIIGSDKNPLTENKATDLDNIYTPMIAMLSEMELEYNELVVKEINEGLSKDAKALRIRISKVRINADKARKDAKAEILRAGNAIQGAYNTLAFAVTSKEEKLLSIEKHYENIEKEKITKLQDNRENQLTDLGIEIFPFGLGEMQIDVWDAYFESVKKTYLDKIEAEKQADIKRIAEEKAEKERIEKIELENKRLEKEAKEKERIVKIEQEKRDKAEKERLEKEKIEQDKRTEKIRIERLEQQKKQDLLNFKIAEAKEQKENLEKQLQDKKDAELKEAKEKADKEKALLLAPDKELLEILAKGLIEYPLPKLNSIEANHILSDVKVLIDEIVAHIKTKSKNL